MGRTLETLDSRRLAERSLNNAAVLAQRLYLTDLDRLDRVLAAHHGELRAAVADMRGRLAAGGDPWRAVEGAATGR